MPELPEVETVKEGLNKRIKGLVIKDIEIRVPSLFKGEKSLVLGAKIEKVWRRAKVLLIQLDTDSSRLRSNDNTDSSRLRSNDKIAASSMTPRNDMITIAIHLKMTGQLVYQGADCKVKVVGGHPQREYNQPLPHGHTHIIIHFTDGSKLYFNDLRKFGWMAVLTNEQLAGQSFIKNVGPEPLGKDYTYDYWLAGLMRRSKSYIKPVLMDQTFIAGIGNIYSDEVLYLAGVRPDRRVGSLTSEETEKIYKVIPFVLMRAMKYGGTSDSTFIGVDGERGDYLKHAYVYHQQTDPKGHKILTKKIGGRTAHFCEIEQR